MSIPLLKIVSTGRDILREFPPAWALCPLVSRLISARRSDWGGTRQPAPTCRGPACACWNPPASSLLRPMSVEGPHDQFIELKVVAGGVGLERAPKVGGGPEIQRLQTSHPCPLLLRQRDPWRGRKPRARRHIDGGSSLPLNCNRSGRDFRSLVHCRPCFQVIDLSTRPQSI